MPLKDISGARSHLVLALSLGPGRPSHRPFLAQLASHKLSGQLLPPSGLSRPEASSPGPASPGLAPSCARPLWAQPLPLSGPSRPRSWPHCDLRSAQLLPLWQPVSTGPARGLPVAPSGQTGAPRWPSCAQRWRSGILSLSRMSSSQPLWAQPLLPAASKGQPSVLASQQPLWTRLLPSSRRPL
ncbi:hypothetical protein P7K49_019130 [Saguinus oedipus]|uniref:Uncharacterized protein n=1 Tax=Saguinus oedipus TaxID=9490 RepID=A0ABQ9UWI6_SAGOE|nr:hypothetical protein P7K49_019130 [Saguinus oedipus]